MKRILFLTVVCLAVAGAEGACWWTRQSLPSLDGEFQVSGLTSPVEVLFDGYGVPHVYATGPEDAWAAAGALHARDRLWQMELYRRAAYGRLSEVLGERTLPIDKRFVTLQLKAAAEREWQAAPEALRLALTQYADGVNAELSRAVGSRKPLEFQLLRFDPAPWTPVDSLAVGRLLAWRLSENHEAELIRYALAARFGANEAQRLAGRYPVSAPAVLNTQTPAHASPVLTDLNASLLDRGSRPAANQQGSPVARIDWPAGLEWLGPGARSGLSNNFVVAPGRTGSGRPLLANDPHLQIEFPAVWYEMHLVAAGLDVAGVSIPGAPFVIIGHNARIAWGVTNTGADVQDFYVERVDLERRRYLSRGQWVPIEITSAEIPVRGRPVVPFEIWRTRHGPLYADVDGSWEVPPPWLSPAAQRTGERRAFALRWNVDGETAAAFEVLDRAENWEQFVAAIDRFSAPSQNFVFADVNGNIGYAMSGVLPVRSDGDGTAPVDGASGAGEWSGRIAGAALPRTLNPTTGYVTSSNNEIDRSFRGLITRDWAAPFRAIRLHQALAGAAKLDVASAAALQNDLTSVAADRVVTGVDSAIKAAKGIAPSDRALGVLEQLRTWDRKVDDRPVSALYEAFEDALWRRTFADEMGKELFDQFYQWAGAERLSGLYAILDDPQSKWFDDVSTISRRETRDEIYMLAAGDALSKVESVYGRQSRWSWSAMHAANFSHALSGAGSPFRWLFNRGPSAIPGDGTTVMRVSFNRLRPFEAWELPSWRQVLDVGAWDNSLVVLPTGQSGHPLSANYFDQNELWRTGQYRAHAFTRDAVDRVRAHRVVLVP